MLLLQHAAAALAAATQVAVARLARVHGWYASPHADSSTLRKATVPPSLDRLAAMPNLALLAKRGSGSTPYQAAHTRQLTPHTAAGAAGLYLVWHVSPILLF